MTEQKQESHVCFDERGFHWLRYCLVARSVLSHCFYWWWTMVNCNLRKSQIVIVIQTFLFNEIYSKMSSVNVITTVSTSVSYTHEMPNSPWWRRYRSNSSPHRASIAEARVVCTVRILRKWKYCHTVWWRAWSKHTSSNRVYNAHPPLIHTHNQICF